MVAPAPHEALPHAPVGPPGASGEPSSGTRIVEQSRFSHGRTLLYKYLIQQPAAAIFADSARFREQTQTGGGRQGQPPPVCASTTRNG